MREARGNMIFIKRNRDGDLENNTRIMSTVIGAGKRENESDIPCDYVRFYLENNIQIAKIILKINK